MMIGEILSADERDALRSLVRRIGERRASSHLGVSRMTLGRAIGGLPLHRGTALLVRTRLAQPTDRAA
jgi:hypothetical protein